MSDEKENEVEVELVELDADTPSMNVLERFVDWLASGDVECLSSIVIVAETISDAGTPEISWWRDNLSGPWKHDGMLDYVKFAIQKNWEDVLAGDLEEVGVDSVSFEEDYDDEEEDDD